MPDRALAIRRMDTLIETYGYAQAQRDLAETAGIALALALHGRTDEARTIAADLHLLGKPILDIDDDDISYLLGSVAP